MTTKHMKLPIILEEGGLIPTRAHLSDAGLDLYSGIEDCVIHPGQRKAIDTAIKFAVPDNHVGLILDKSGLALNRGLTILGGVIDSGYRGDIKVIVHNTSDEDVLIQYGNKIAQLVIMPIVTPEVQVMPDLPPAEDERGEGGFGSTGI